MSRPQHQLLQSKVVVEDKSHVSLVRLSHLQEKVKNKNQTQYRKFLDCKLQVSSAHIVLE